MSSIREIALAKAVGGGGPSVTVEELTVTENGTYTAPSDKAYSPVVVAVPQGGGSVAPNDVNFYDYDGTIVASYSAADFANLTALPTNPDRTSEGLTAQGWNWTLADAKTYVAAYGMLEIGQMYITTDGKTHVHIHLEQGRTSPILGCCPNGTVDVDWGDGTTHDTLTGTSTSTVKWTSTHNYAAPGNYVIKLTVTGSMGFYGCDSTDEYSGLLRYSSTNNALNTGYRSSINAVFIGSGVSSISDFAFALCSNITSITVPNNVTSIGTKAFVSCRRLESIVIPSSVTSIGSGIFRFCYKIVCVLYPNSITGIFDSIYNSCYALINAVIPNGITELNSSFTICQNMYRVTMPSNITKIGALSFNNCNNLISITIPSGVTNIGVQAFSYCYCLSAIHFKPTTPPTVVNSNAWADLPTDCKIYVPTGSLSAYTSANNYPSSSTYTYVEE